MPVSKLKLFLNSVSEMKTPKKNPCNNYKIPLHTYGNSERQQNVQKQIIDCKRKSHVK